MNTTCAKDLTNLCSHYKTKNSPLHQQRLGAANALLSNFSWESVGRKWAVIRKCKTKKTPKLRRKEVLPRALNSSLWRIWYTADELDAPPFLCLKNIDAANLRIGSTTPTLKKRGRRKEITLNKYFKGIIDETFMYWSGPWSILVTRLPVVFCWDC